MGLQEIQNERFENSEYWPKQDSEVLNYSTDKHDASLLLPVAADEINKSEECNHRSLRPGRAVNQDTIKAPSRPAPAPPRTTRPPQRLSSGVTEVPRCAEAAAITAVQRLVAHEERIRQSLRYEQQVICAKRYANFGHVFQKLYCRLFQPSLNSGQTSTPPNELKEPGKRSLKELADSSKATPKKNTAKSNAPPNKNKASEYSGVLAKLETSLENSLKRSLSDLRRVVELLGNCSPSVSVRTNKWNKFVEKQEPRPVSSVTKRRQNESQVTECRTDELQASLDDFNAWSRSHQERDQANERNLQGTANQTSRYPNTEGASKRWRGQRAGCAVQRRHAAVKLLELFETMVGPKKWTWLYQGKRSSSQVAACPPRETWGQAVQPRRCEDTNNPFS